MNRSRAVSHGAVIRSSAENHAGIAIPLPAFAGASAGALARSVLADHRGGVLEQLEVLEQARADRLRGVVLLAAIERKRRQDAG